MNKEIIGLTAAAILIFLPLSFAVTAKTTTKAAPKTANCATGAKYVKIQLKNSIGKMIKGRVKCNELQEIKKGITVELP